MTRRLVAALKIKNVECNVALPQPGGKVAGPSSVLFCRMAIRIAGILGSVVRQASGSNFGASGPIASRKNVYRAGPGAKSAKTLKQFIASSPYQMGMVKKSHKPILHRVYRSCIVLTTLGIHGTQVGRRLLQLAETGQFFQGRRTQVRYPTCLLAANTGAGTVARCRAH